MFVLQDKLLEAEKLFKRTLKIVEKSLGHDLPKVATILSNRASLLVDQVRAARNLQETSCGV